MTTTTPRRENGTDDAPFSPGLTQHVDLGDDREGNVHHLDRETGAVHAIAADGSRVRRTDLTSYQHGPAPVALEAYIQVIADGVGWDDRRKYVGADLFGRVA
jgi:hypothetical protein